MRIFINALSLKEQMGGGYTFGINLARALNQHYDARDAQVVLLGGRHNAQLLRQAGCQVFDLGAGLAHPGRRISFERSFLASRIAPHPDDIFVSLDGVLPRNLPCAQIPIFQNLIYFHPELILPAGISRLRSRFYAGLQHRYFLSAWRRAARLCDHALFPSEAARAEFLVRYPDLRSRAAVIYEGVDPCFEPASGPDLTQPYLLAVGTLYPHKRLDLAIELLAQVEQLPQLRLVIAGADWHGNAARLRNLARRHKVADRVEILGHVGLSKLVSLYGRALCLVQTSEVEAFGLPIAEALACGTPVLVADRSALPEIAGDGGLALTPGLWSEGVVFVERLWNDVSFREDRRRAALRRAAQFGWSRIAEQYAQLFAAVSRARMTIRTAAPRSHRTKDRLESTYRHLPLPLQQVAVNIAGLRNRRTRFGADFRQELEFLERSERLPSEQLSALQADRLGKLVRTAYEHVPFYRDLFRSHGLTPADIRTPGDLRKLPVLEKATVAANAGAMVNTTLAPRDRIPGHTSGSTGTSLTLVHDAPALAAEFATVWRMRRRFGCDLDRWHATFAGRLFVPVTQTQPPYHRVNYVQKQLLFSLYHLSPATVSHYAEALAKRTCDFYTGYPSALEVLVRHAEEAGVRLPGPSRALFTSSETLLARQKDALERTLGVPVFDRYGCAEFCVSFTVCERGRYHLDSEFAIVEWEPLEENELSVTGALICTGLTNHAMPFIRYRVGDVATIAKTPCPCGRASLSALSIDGRREDFVITGDGVRLGRLDHIFKDLHTIRESQILQSEPGRITIRVVRGPEYRPPDEEHLLAECRKRMGESMAIRVEYTDTIARNAAGKFRAVINTMKEAQRYDN